MDLELKRGSVFWGIAVCIALVTLGVVLVKTRKPLPTGASAAVVQERRTNDTLYLREIAAALGVTPRRDRTAGDLCGDLRIALDDARQRCPDPLPDELMNNLKDVLGPADWKEICARNDFLKELRNARVFVFPKSK